MGINLTKGEKIILRKDNGSSVKSIMIGTTWGIKAPMIEKPKIDGIIEVKEQKGILSTIKGMFKKENTIRDVVDTIGRNTKDASDVVSEKFNEVSKNVSIDIDTSVICFRETEGKKFKLDTTVFYGDKDAYCNAIRHLGDDLTGKNKKGLDNDNETILVDLERLPKDVNRLFVISNVFGSGVSRQHFGQAGNGYIRLVDRDNNSEICRSYIDSDLKGATGMVVAEMYKQGKGWRFKAISEPNGKHRIASITDLILKKHL